ncbi:MAG: family ATP-binding cassette protein, partial [Thermoleophilia bacterium]|nr:family ATP-binding cassette protein [Thermoleophilia bacterium]
AGKTTLLRVLARQLSPTAGQVRVQEHIHVGLHDQRPTRSPLPLRTWVAPERMVQAEAELRELESSMADGDPAKLEAWTHVRARYDAMGGESWVADTDAVLRGLGFTEAQFEQTIDTLSGGELTRASLARTLASKPDLLLLDEPTNHLDIDTIDWLQDHLAGLQGGLVLVSHDRWFIEAVCTSVIEISDGRGRHFKGSFVEYRAQQALEAVSHQKELERWQGEVARLQRFVDRFGAGTRSRQAQSRAKVLDKLREDAPAYADVSTRQAIGFQLPKVTPPGRTVFEAIGLSLEFEPSENLPGRVLLEPSNLVVERGEKIALIGPNGAGKSTFLHAIGEAAVMHAEPCGALVGGEIRVGYGVKTRLLSQHDSELVDNQSMLGNMNLAAPNIGRTDAQNLLGLFGFRGDDAQRLVATMSGGERRRLMMAMALTGADNVLLLDEPTNHLDIESREGLEAALADWPGTIIMISHDRALVEGVATRCVVLHDQTITTVVGGYEQARAVLAGEIDAPPTDPGAVLREAEAKSKAEKVEKSERRDRAGSKPAKQPASSDGARRTVKRGSGGGGGSKQRDGGAKVRRPATIESEIEQLDAKLVAVNELMLDPDVYTDGIKSASALKEHAQLERDLAARWQELERSTEVYGS